MTGSKETGQPTIPQLDLVSILEGATDFASAQAAIIKVTTEMLRQGVARIGFVSGPIDETSQFVSEENGSAMEKSMREMRRVTEALIAEHKFPIFSSTDIFWAKWDELSEGRRIQEGTLVGDEKDKVMNAFFGGILEKGGITDIFMMKGWENAPGARYERGVAEKPSIAIRVHDLALKQ